MARDATSSPTVSRLAARASKNGLRRQAMPGGGEVFTGDLASRSLKSLGARAMTVDRSIVVSEDFDPNKPEDQALFAHEQYHLEHSGGQGTHEARDGEEVAARAVERMVLHRAAGGAEMHEASHTSSPGGAPTGAAGAGHEKDAGTEKNSAAGRGYSALLDQGLTHRDVVDKLTREALNGLENARESRLERYGDKKGFL